MQPEHAGRDPGSESGDDSTVLCGEHLFGGPDLRGTVAQDVQVSPRGSFVSWLLPMSGRPDVAVIWLLSGAGGRPRPLLTTADLAAPRAALTDAEVKALERRHKASRDLLEYSWSETSDTLLVTLGDHQFLVDAATGKATPLALGAGAKADVRLAPGDRYISFVRDQRVVLHDLEDGETTTIGHDAGDAISYGTAEFVAQEEILRHQGTWWSPSGQHIAYTRVDESQVTRVPRLQIGATTSSIAYDRFPRAGTRNAGVDLFVRHIRTGVTTAVDLGEDRDIYLADVRWSRNGTVLYVQRQRRDQQQVDLLAVDIADGSSTVLVSETSGTWVDLERDFFPLADGTFFWGSTRTGTRHLYHFDADGRLIRAVTSGAWRLGWGGPAAPANYATVVGIDEDQGIVYFIASICSPLEQHLYAVSYRSQDVPRQITSGEGRWIPTMAEVNPRCFVGEYSDMERPPRTGLYSLDGTLLTWLSENRLDTGHPLHPFLGDRPTYEFGVLPAADGTDLHYVMGKPPDFEPTKRYPVVIKVYGGPGVQTVRREWRPLTDQLLTQAGFIVFQLDNRGTSNRAEAFEHATYRDLGRVTSDDQAAGVKFLSELGFVDSSRIGMTGWSFGGYLTLRMMTRPASGIRAGIAGGVPADFHLYDTHYTERFLGLPLANQQAYADGALLPRAKHLEGDLLLIHGLSDDNVVLENFTSLVAELQAQGKLFATMVYPGQGHLFRGGAALTHLWNTYLAFFREHLAPAAECP